MQILNSNEIAKTGIKISIIIFVFALAIAAVFGWVFNIMTLSQSLDSELTVMLIMRVIGIIVMPLGAILGWIG